MFSKYRVVEQNKYLICNRQVANRLKQLGVKVEYVDSDAGEGLGTDIIQQPDVQFIKTCEAQYFGDN